LIYHISQHVVDEYLEDRWGVGQPEGHDQVFKVPPGGVKSGLPFVTFPFLWSRGFKGGVTNDVTKINKCKKTPFHLSQL